MLDNITNVYLYLLVILSYTICLGKQDRETITMPLPG